MWREGRRPKVLDLSPKQHQVVKQCWAEKRLRRTPPYKRVQFSLKLPPLSTHPALNLRMRDVAVYLIA